MTSWLAKIFNFGASPNTGPINLESIAQSGDNFELVPATAFNPQYLLAHGVVTGVEPKMDVHTAINAANGLEFSTVVGQVPNNNLGLAITDALNHKLDGKFLTFDADQKEKRDVVYSTAYQYFPKNMSPELFVHQELENHAKTQVLVAPILSASQSYLQPSIQLNNQSVVEVGRQIVESNLKVQNTLTSGQTIHYVPLP